MPMWITDCVPMYLWISAGNNLVGCWVIIGFGTGSSSAPLDPRPGVAVCGRDIVSGPHGTLDQTACIALYYTYSSSDSVTYDIMAFVVLSGATQLLF